MAKDKEGALPSTFEPDSYYAIRLLRAVQFAGRTLSPGKSQTMLGSVAEGFRDDIASAEIVSDGDGPEEA